jgi:hypothetical protein
VKMAKLQKGLVKFPLKKNYLLLLLLELTRDQLRFS